MPTVAILSYHNQTPFTIFCKLQKIIVGEPIFVEHTRSVALDYDISVSDKRSFTSCKLLLSGSRNEHSISPS